MGTIIHHAQLLPLDYLLRPTRPPCCGGTYTTQHGSFNKTKIRRSHDMAHGSSIAAKSAGSAENNKNVRNASCLLSPSHM